MEGKWAAKGLSAWESKEEIRNGVQVAVPKGVKLTTAHLELVRSKKGNQAEQNSYCLRGESRKRFKK
ncbi:hypothetical protein CVT25_005642 [Psilocybe cyanescens]|uniref:Uncharacterized protein n=1 Tax=Psilocybe cyanescens TaxID=93625 RepID=A0A409X6J0_PSICY|nr:hypothetical protein CVT25_005642 [Psilocybe cyanescens]